MERSDSKWGKPTFSSQIFCFPLGPGQSLGVEMCSVFHCGCGGKKEVVVKMKKAETQPKGGQALNSDRDSDHVCRSSSLCPPVGLLEARWRQDGGLGCRASNGEDTFQSPVLTTY